jgi:hypothetical protein
MKVSLARPPEAALRAQVPERTSVEVPENDVTVPRQCVEEADRDGQIVDGGLTMFGGHADRQGTGQPLGSMDLDVQRRCSRLEGRVYDSRPCVANNRIGRLTALRGRAHCPHLLQEAAQLPVAHAAEASMPRQVCEGAPIEVTQNDVPLSPEYIR